MGESLGIKITNIVFYAIFAISVVLGIVFYFVNSNEEPLLVGAYVLTIAAAGSVLVSMIAGMFKSKKSAVMSLIVMAVFAVLIIISYSLASDVIPLNVAGEVIDDRLTAAGSKWSGASLYMLYILLGVSFISLIYTEIRGAFK